MASTIGFVLAIGMGFAAGFLNSRWPKEGEQDRSFLWFGVPLLMVLICSGVALCYLSDPFEGAGGTKSTIIYGQNQFLASIGMLLVGSMLTARRTKSATTSVS